jgi:hypothetical protein
VNTEQKLRLIRRKRLALEQLIAIGKNINGQGNILSDILVLSRPSQTISKKVKQSVMHMVQTLQELSIAELKQRLIIIDQLVAQGSQEIINLTFNSDFLPQNLEDLSCEVEHIKQLITVFKKRTELAIALRLVLQEMGVSTQRLQVEFSQEILLIRVSELKREERSCRNNIHKRIEEVIDDCDTLIKSGIINAALEAELKQVKSVMQQNIEHLAAGKSIDSMPINFEAIEVGDTSPSLDMVLVDQENPIIENNSGNEVQTIIPEPDLTDSSTSTAVNQSFTKRLTNWLNAPWDVGWKNNGNKH